VRPKVGSVRSVVERAAQFPAKRPVDRLQRRSINDRAVVGQVVTFERVALAATTVDFRSRYLALTEVRRRYVMLDHS